MNDKRKDIRKHFKTDASISDTKTNLLTLYPDISLKEISKEFKKLALKELEKADSDKVSIEIIKGDTFWKYQFSSRIFYVSTKDKDEIYFDKDEVLSSKVQSRSEERR